MVVNNKTINQYCYSILVLLYIYSVNYNFLPIDTSKITWLFIISLTSLSLLFNKSFRIYFLRHLYDYKFFLIFVITFIIVTVLAVYNNASNFTLSYYLIIYLIDYIPVGIFLSFIFNKKNIQPINIIVNVGVIQAILIFGMLLIPSFKSYYANLVSISGNILDYYSYRNVGITGFANYTVGTTQAFILCLFIYDLLNKQVLKLRHIIISILLLLSAAFSSRSSLLVICFFIFYMYFGVLNKRYIYTRFLPVISIILLILSLILLYLLENRYIINDSFVLKWALEPILNFIDFGELTTRSSDTLSSFYFYPGDNTFFYGDWKYVNLDGTYYQSVDAGYMRLMLYMGAPLSLLIYFSFVLSFLSLKNVRFFSVYFIFIIMLLHYKGNAFVDASAMFKLYFIYFTSVIHRKYYGK